MVIKKDSTTKYRAIVHKPNSDLAVIKSIWCESKEEAIKAGKIGVKFYGGTHYTIEKEGESNNG